MNNAKIQYRLPLWNTQVFLCFPHAEVCTKDFPPKSNYEKRIGPDHSYSLYVSLAYKVRIILLLCKQCVHACD